MAHAVGNIELKLHEWDVDFACWCSYKVKQFKIMHKRLQEFHVITHFVCPPFVISKCSQLYGLLNGYLHFMKLVQMKPVIDPFNATRPFLYPVKTSDNQMYETG